jgi:hypothetical protein
MAEKESTEQCVNVPEMSRFGETITETEIQTIVETSMRVDSE